MEENKPKSLKDFLGESNQKEKSLDEILNADAEDERKELKSKNDALASRNKKVILGALAGIVVIGGGALVFPWLSDVTSTTPPAPKLEAPVTTGNSGQPWYDSNQIEDLIPVTVPEYAKDITLDDASKLSETHLAATEKALGSTDLYHQSRLGLTSEERGYTSDLDKIRNSDGTLNVDFAYVTHERFLVESGDILNRLLNPVYGGWVNYQFATGDVKTSFPVQNFKNIFSERYINENFGKDDKSFFPVYADWNSNNYGMDNLVPNNVAGRWYGSVSSADVQFYYDKSNLNYQFHAVYQVKYTSFTADKQKVSKDGTLTIKYITDRTSVGSSNEYRIRIDEASLVVK